jgi:hypothetical protein
MQLMAFMEEQQSVAHNPSNTKLILSLNQTSAANYEDRFAKTYGKKL